MCDLCFISCRSVYFRATILIVYSYGLFQLPNSDSDSDSDSDSKPYGYMVLCRTCFHWLGFRFGSLSHSICIVEASESEFESESESESGNGNKPLVLHLLNSPGPHYGRCWWSTHHSALEERTASRLYGNRLFWVQLYSGKFSSCKGTNRADVFFTN